MQDGRRRVMISLPLLWKLRSSIIVECVCVVSWVVLRLQGSQGRNAAEWRNYLRKFDTSVSRIFQVSCILL